MYRLIFILVFLSSAVRAEPMNFRANYVAEYQGFPVKAAAVRELSKLDDHRFRLVSSVQSIIIKVTEITEFEYRNQQLRPLIYTYHRTGLGKKKSEELEFDWDGAQLIRDDNRSPLEDGTLDKLSLQHKLTQDVAELMQSDDQATELIYQVVDKDKQKPYHFKIVSEEVLATPLGNLRTVLVQRIRDKKKSRHTRFWLAIDHGYLLVKAVQTENDQGLELNLVSAIINGVEMTGN